jgi:hypothetical protein
MKTITTTNVTIFQNDDASATTHKVVDDNGINDGSNSATETDKQKNTPLSIQQITTKPIKFKSKPQSNVDHDTILYYIISAIAICAIVIASAIFIPIYPLSAIPLITAMATLLFAVGVNIIKSFIEKKEPDKTGLYLTPASDSVTDIDNTIKTTPEIKTKRPSDTNGNVTGSYPGKLFSKNSDDTSTIRSTSNEDQSTLPQTPILQNNRR